jgi:hydrogenase maturation factor
MNDFLPIGKLPVELLGSLLEKIPITDPRIKLGPGVGLDCTVINVGSSLLVFKTDPITFTSQDIGWYAVNINANDIATTAAVPQWLLAALLLPESSTTSELVEKIFDQIIESCTEIGITLVGGHTEVTHGIDRPILIGTMIGEVGVDDLVTPQGAVPGDRILLTKGVPIEAVSILAREFEDELSVVLTKDEIAEAKNYIKNPGISVLPDSKIAVESGIVHAMHDPTEGGLLAALWELSDASGQSILIDTGKIPVPEIAGMLCRTFGINPLGAIASGALLLAADPDESLKIQRGLRSTDILCEDIGCISRDVEKEAGLGQGVFSETESGIQKLDRPKKDEITKLFSS